MHRLVKVAARFVRLRDVYAIVYADRGVMYINAAAPQGKIIRLYFSTSARARIS